MDNFCAQSRGPGQRLWLSHTPGWAKSQLRPKGQAWLGPAFFGLAWPSFWPQAKAGTSLPLQPHFLPLFKGDAAVASPPPVASIFSFWPVSFISSVKYLCYPSLVSYKNSKKYQQNGQYYCKSKVLGQGSLVPK